MTRRMVSLLLLGAGSGLAQTPHDHTHHAAVEPAREEALKPSPSENPLTRRP